MKTPFAVRLMYSNVHHTPRQPEGFWTLLGATGVDAVSYFAVVNNALLFRGNYDPDLHAELEAEFADDGLRDALAEHRQNAETFVALFNRPAHLLSMKLLLGMAEEEKGETALSRIGDLTLHANDYIESPEDVWDGYPGLLGVLAEFAPIWELINPRDGLHLFTRTYLLLTEHLPENKGMSELLRTHLGAALPELRIDGLRIDDYLALVFGMFQNTKDAVLKEHTCIIPIDQFFEVTTLPHDGIRAFLERRCGDAAEFRDELHVDLTTEEIFTAYIADGTKAMDATVIKQRPIFRRSDGRYSVLDGRFLIELLSTTLYWTMFDAITDKDARSTFSGHWGDCFEALVVRELGYFYPPMSSILRTQVQFPGGAIDALLDYGDFVILFEIKSGLLAKDPRLMRNPERLRAELHKKFVDGTGIWQLTKAARAVVTGKTGTLRTDCRIYPILVGDEPFLQCFAANRYLDEQFSAQYADRPPNVAPLTAMVIDELEEALPYVAAGDIGWRAILDARFEVDDVSPDSVHTTLAHIRTARNLPRRPNSFLSEHGQRIGRLITERYHLDRMRRE